jgi:hypothetical protein
MKKFSLVILSALLSFSLFARDIDWNRFDQSFNQDARYESTPYGIFATLERFEEIENGHWANYFSGVGGFNNEGEFVSGRYELVSEKWYMVEGAWHTDQWLFAFNTRHQITFRLHRIIKRKADNIGVEIVDIRETNEAYELKSNELLLEWLEHIED